LDNKQAEEANQTATSSKNQYQKQMNRSPGHMARSWDFHVTKASILPYILFRDETVKPAISKT
jgi:hypothetical protein